MTNQIDKYLAEGEQLILSFGADSVNSGENNGPDLGFQSTEYMFGATDRRLVYLGDDGSFKDIEYRHISSIETDNDTDVPAGAVAAGCCGGILVVTGVVGLADSPIGAIGSLIIGVVLVAVAVKLFSDDTEKQNIKIITGDEADQQLEFTTSDNIGAELSSIVREHSET
jgi:hypothetical protein